MVFAAGVVAVYAKIAGGFADAAFVAMAPAVLSLRFIWRNLRRLKIGQPYPFGDVLARGRAWSVPRPA